MVGSAVSPQILPQIHVEEFHLPARTKPVLSQRLCFPKNPEMHCCRSSEKCPKKECISTWDCMGQTNTFTSNFFVYIPKLRSKTFAKKNPKTPFQIPSWKTHSGFQTFCFSSAMNCSESKLLPTVNPKLCHAQRS